MSNKTLHRIADEYDDLTGFVADELLVNVLHDEEEQNPHYEVKLKKRNPDYPEDWQYCVVQVFSREDEFEFLKLMQKHGALIERNQIHFKHIQGF